MRISLLHPRCSFVIISALLPFSRTQFSSTACKLPPGPELRSGSATAPREYCPSSHVFASRSSPPCVNGLDPEGSMSQVNKGNKTLQRNVYIRPWEDGFYVGMMIVRGKSFFFSKSDLKKPTWTGVTNRNCQALLTSSRIYRYDVRREE